jgi:sec-independent protein translocase protein TatC
MAENKKNANELSFLEHVEVLRWHLIRGAAAVGVFTVVAFLAKRIVFDLIIFGPKDPNFLTYRFFCRLSEALGMDDAFCMEELPFSLQNIEMAGQFTTHLWVSFIAGIILAFPYLVYELWRFVKPALKASERKYSTALIFFTSFLFTLGILFGYFLIAPLSVNFLGGYSVSEQISSQINLGSYISTVTTVTMACGVVFELPILVYFLTKIGLLTPEWMKAYRRHAFVVTLVLSAVITPPDVASQILVTIPIIILYEISIGISKRVIKRQQRDGR